MTVGTGHGLRLKAWVHSLRSSLALKPTLTLHKHRAISCIGGRLTVKLPRQGGETMTLALRISLLVMLVSLFGCASQIQPAQTSQPVAEKVQQEQQPKKPAFPTFTYRPGG